MVGIGALAGVVHCSLFVFFNAFDTVELRHDGLGNDVYLVIAYCSDRSFLYI